MSSLPLRNQVNRGSTNSPSSSMVSFTGRLDTRMFKATCEVALMPDPAIHVLGEPGDVLAAAPHSYGFEPGLFCLRHQVERAI